MSLWSCEFFHAHHGWSRPAAPLLPSLDLAPRAIAQVGTLGRHAPAPRGRGQDRGRVCGNRHAVEEGVDVCHTRFAHAPAPNTPAGILEPWRRLAGGSRAPAIQSSMSARTQRVVDLALFTSNCGGPWRCCLYLNVPCTRVGTATGAPRLGWLEESAHPAQLPPSRYLSMRSCPVGVQKNTRPIFIRHGFAHSWPPRCPGQIPCMPGHAWHAY